MACVWQKPRFIDQALNRLLSHCIVANNVPLFEETVKLLRADMHWNWDAIESAERYWRTKNLEYLKSDLSFELEPKTYELLRACQISAMGVRRPTIYRDQHASIARAIRDLLVEITPSATTIYSDIPGVMKLLADLVVATGSPPSMRTREDVWIENTMKSMVLYQGAGTFVNSHALWDKIATTEAIGKRSSLHIRMEKIASALERLAVFNYTYLVSQCGAVHFTPRRMKQKHFDFEIEYANMAVRDRHKVIVKGATDVLPKWEVWNFNGALVILAGKRLVVLDPSSMSVLRECANRFKHMACIASDYRLCDRTTDEAAAFRDCMHEAFEWIINAIHATDGKSLFNLPRSMHLGHERVQNLLGEDEAVVDYNSRANDAAFKNAEAVMIPGLPLWSEKLLSFRISDRDKMEIGKIHHILPPPDVDPRPVFDRIKADQAAEGEVSDEFITEFTSFCGAYDLCRVMRSEHAVPRVWFEDPVPDTWVGEKWARSCLAGRFVMMPEEYWGHLRMHKHFHYSLSADYAYLAPEDCTHVCCGNADAMRPQAFGPAEAIKANEILWSLTHGDILSNGMSARECRERLLNGEAITLGDMTVTLAIKSETTKPPEKSRETFSANDVFRELQAEADKAGQHIGSYLPGCSMRLPPAVIQKQMRRMAMLGIKEASQAALLSSTDYEKWSPKLNRRLFYAHYRLLMSYTDCEEMCAIFALWDRIVVIMNKRGYVNSFKASKGNFQGFPATMDTVLHTHGNIYFLFEARKTGLLGKTEFAYMLQLIDDEAFAIRFEGPIANAPDRARRLMDSYVEVCARLGWAVSWLKSFVSSIKFVFLNNLFCDGSLVLHSCATYVKPNRDFDRRFASPFSHIDTIVGGFAAAAEKGVDPIAAYAAALHDALRYVVTVCNDVCDIDEAAAGMIALAPRGSLGWGLPTLLVFVTDAPQDRDASFHHLYHRQMLVGMPMCARQTFWKMMRNPYKECSAHALATDPFSIKHEEYHDMEGAISRRLRDAATRLALAQPWSGIASLSDDPAVEVAYKELLSHSTLDAAWVAQLESKSPLAMLMELMAKIERNEVVTLLMRPREVSSLKGMIRRKTRKMFMLASLLSETDEATICQLDEALAAAPSWEYTQAVRDDYHRANQAQFINHTYPVPQECMAYQGIRDRTAPALRRTIVVSFMHENLVRVAGAARPNVFDSRLRAGNYFGAKSEGLIDSENPAVKVLDPMARRITAMVTLFKYGEDRGWDVQEYANLMFRLWSSVPTTRLGAYTPDTISGSTKRLCAAIISRNHPIRMLPNTAGLVAVDVTALEPFLYGIHHSLDIMDVITVLRAIGLLTWLLERHKIGVNKEMRFLVTPGSIAQAAPDRVIARVNGAGGTIRPLDERCGSLATDIQMALNPAIVARRLNTIETAGALAARNMAREILAEVEEGIVNVDDLPQIMGQVVITPQGIERNFSHFSHAKPKVVIASKQVHTFRDTDPAQMASTRRTNTRPNEIMKLAAAAGMDTALGAVAGSFLQILNAAHAAKERGWFVLLDQLDVDNAESVAAFVTARSKKGNPIMGAISHTDSFLSDLAAVQCPITSAAKVKRALELVRILGFHTGGQANSSSVRSFFGTMANTSQLLKALKKSGSQVVSGRAGDYIRTVTGVDPIGASASVLIEKHKQLATSYAARRVALLDKKPIDAGDETYADTDERRIEHGRVLDAKSAFYRSITWNTRGALVIETTQANWVLAMRDILTSMATEDVQRRIIARLNVSEGATTIEAAGNNLVRFVGNVIAMTDCAEHRLDATSIERAMMACVVWLTSDMAQHGVATLQTHIRAYAATTEAAEADAEGEEEELPPGMLQDLVERVGGAGSARISLRPDEEVEVEESQGSLTNWQRVYTAAGMDDDTDDAACIILGLADLNDIASITATPGDVANVQRVLRELAESVDIVRSDIPSWIPILGDEVEPPEVGDVAM